MVCHTSGAISLSLHLFWCSMDYPNLVCLICISGCIKMFPWSHCLIVSVISYLNLAWMNSEILPRKSPEIISCLINCSQPCFYCRRSWNVSVVEPCLLPTHILGFSPYLCSREIYAPVFHNSNVSLPFAQTKLECFLLLLFTTCSCLLFDAYNYVSYVYLCQTRYCLTIF